MVEVCCRGISIVHVVQCGCRRGEKKYGEELESTVIVRWPGVCEWDEKEKAVEKTYTSG
jgi:hypothetical protein